MKDVLRKTTEYWGQPGEEGLALLVLGLPLPEERPETHTYPLRRARTADAVTTAVVESGTSSIARGGVA